MAQISITVDGVAQQVEADQRPTHLFAENKEVVVCRVNGLPNATVESCEEMPPAEAYWAVYVKKYESFPIPFNTEGEWGWAQTGINEVHLNNGDQ